MFGSENERKRYQSINGAASPWVILVPQRRALEGTRGGSATQPFPRVSEHPA